MAAIRPTTWLSRTARKKSTSECSWKGCFWRLRTIYASTYNGGTHCGLSLYSRKGNSTNCLTCFLFPVSTFSMLSMKSPLHGTLHCITQIRPGGFVLYLIKIKQRDLYHAIQRTTPGTSQKIC